MRHNVCVYVCLCNLAGQDISALLPHRLPSIRVRPLGVIRRHHMRGAMLVLPHEAYLAEANCLVGFLLHVECETSPRQLCGPLALGHHHRRRPLGRRVSIHQCDHGERKSSHGHQREPAGGTPPTSHAQLGHKGPVCANTHTHVCQAPSGSLPLCCQVGSSP